MTARRVGIVVVGETVTLVDAQVPGDAAKPILIEADHSWKLQQDDQPAAYAIIHQRCADYLTEHKVDGVVIKASALPTGACKLGHLRSAETRGVIIAAAASVCAVRVIQKAVISRTYGERKVDEYLNDDAFWAEKTTGGKLRKSSREAAMLLVATRGK